MASNLYEPYLTNREKNSVFFLISFESETGEIYLQNLVLTTSGWRLTDFPSNPDLYIFSEGFL